MRLVLALFSSVVFAAEGIISPLADPTPQPVVVRQPAVSFGVLAQPSQTPTPTPTPTQKPTLTPTPMPAILGESTQTATPSTTPTPVTYRARKRHFAIALLGDSMIDTLGPDVPALKNMLTALFPGTTFTMLNYGVGATNIDYGLFRLTNQYTYLGNTIEPLDTLAPDVVIVESFAYNPYPFEDGALDKHWLALGSIVDTLKTHIPGVKVMIAATIAPNSHVFADGAAGLSFSSDQKWQKTQTIKSYLDSTVKFAQGQNLPFADAFHPSMDKNGEGNLLYINPGDHIHYSESGKVFFAQKVADALIKYGLLQ